MKELTTRMEQALRFIVDRGGAHPGKDFHSTFRALERRGLIEFEGWGRDDDLQIDGDVMLYRPTDAGRRYFDGRFYRATAASCSPRCPMRVRKRA